MCVLYDTPLVRKMSKWDGQTAGWRETLFLNDEELDPYQRMCMCVFVYSIVQQAVIQQGHWASGDGYGQCVIIYN